MADVSVPSTVLSAGVGAIFGLVAAAFKSFLDARRKVDEDLRGKRGPEYLKLWQHTKPFSKYPECKANYSHAQDLQRHLTNWSYGDGGLYLSRKSQSAYAKLFRSLSDAMNQVDSNSRKADGEDGGDAERKLTIGLSATSIAEIQDKCARLQRALTGDLLSRTSGRRVL